MPCREQPSGTLGFSLPHLDNLPGDVVNYRRRQRAGLYDNVLISGRRKSLRAEPQEDTAGEPKDWAPGAPCASLRDVGARK